MQELDGADEMVARLQAATSQSASTFSWEGARSILFRVLHLMAERKEGKATSKSSNVTSVLLLLFDFVQVVAVLASPEFGYTFDIFAWVSSLSIGRALGIQLIGVGWAMTLWGMSTLVLVLALSNAILVAWQVASGGHTGSLLPLRTLRAFVTLALTALYIPLVQSTARFLACDRIVAEAAAVGQDFPRCWGPTHAVLFGISVLVLVLFIPFALVVRGIFFDDTPTGGSVVSKPIARTEMLDTACRTTVVLAGMFLTPSNRLLVLLIVAILYMTLLLLTVHYLPFYRRGMTMLRVGQVCLYGWLAVGAFLLEATRRGGMPTSDLSTLATVLLVGMPVMLLVGAALAYRRSIKMQHVAAVAAEHAIRSALAAAEAGPAEPHSMALRVGAPEALTTMVPFSTPAELKQTASSLSMKAAGSDGPETPTDAGDNDDGNDDKIFGGDDADVISLGGAMRVDASKLVSEADPSNEAPQPLPAPGQVHDEVLAFLDRQLTSAPKSGSLASHAGRFLSSETDVELMVRTLLRTPTPRAVFYAKALLEEALDVYPESVYCRIVYATFLFNWASNEETLRAVGLLVDAARLPAALDLQYTLYARITSVLELRRKMQIGTSGADVDSIGLIEFKQQFRQAERRHLAAIRGLSAWWASIASGSTDGVTMRGGSVSDKLEAIARSCSAAERGYLGLMERYPQAKALARAYGIFLVNARVDETGTTYTRAGEDVDEAMGSAGASASGFSGSGPSANTSRTSGTEVARRRQQRLAARSQLDIPVVTSTTRGFRLALVGLIMALIGIFVSTAYVFSTIRLSVETMDAAGLRRKLTESAWYGARGLQLLAIKGDTASFGALQSHVLKEMQTLGAKHSFLYYSGRRFPTINTMWNSKTSVKFDMYNPDVSLSRRRWVQSLSLWDAGNLFVATTSRMAKQNMSQFLSATTMPEWRFVMDNAKDNMLNTFEKAVGLYQAEDQQLVAEQTAIQAALLACKVIVLSLLATCVFWPALRSVHVGKSSLQLLVTALPRRLGKHMARRYRRIERMLVELDQAGLTLEDVDPTSQRYKTLKAHDFLLRIKSRAKPSRRAHATADRAAAKASLHEAAEIGNVGGNSSNASSLGSDRASQLTTPTALQSETTKQAPKAAGKRGRRPSLHSELDDSSSSVDTGMVTTARRSSPRSKAPGMMIPFQDMGDSVAKDDEPLIDLDDDDGAASAALLVTDGDMLQGVHDAEELSTLVRQRQDALKRGATYEDAMKTELGFDGGGVGMAPEGNDDDDDDDASNKPPSTGDGGDGDVRSGLDDLLAPAPPKAAAAKPRDRTQSSDRTAGGGPPRKARASLLMDDSKAVGPPATASASPQPASGKAPSKAVTSRERQELRPAPAARPASEAPTADTTGLSLPWRACCCCRARTPAPASSRRGRKKASDTVTTMASVLQDKQLRSVTLQAVGVMILLVIAQVANFFLTLDISQSGSAKPAELNNAGRRRYLARETFNTVRELLVGDGEVGTLDQLSDRLRHYSSFYRRVHDGLRHGDEGLGLPGSERRYPALEALMYAQGGVAFVAQSIASLQEPGAVIPQDALASFGVDPLFRLYISSIEELTQQFSNTSEARPGRDWDGLMRNPKLKLSFDLERGPIGSGFGAAVKLYKSEGLKEVATLESLQSGLVGLELVLVLLVYSVVHRIVRKALRREYTRSLDVQAMVPPSIAAADPNLATWRHAVRHHSFGGQDALHPK